MDLQSDKPLIYDTDNLILEELKDELPDYMSKEVSHEFGEEYLEMDSAKDSKIPEVQDGEYTISWNDVGLDKDKFLTQIVGNLTSNLVDEVSSQIRAIVGSYNSFNSLISISNHMDAGGHLGTALQATMGEISKITATGSSPESLEDELEHFIKLIYGNHINSIKYNSANVEKGGSYDYNIHFEAYDNRKTSLNKQLRRLDKFIREVQRDNKSVEGDEEVFKIVGGKVLDKIKEIRNHISSGALKSIIKSVIDQMDEIKENNIKPKLLISSKPDDFLRMSVSPFYNSCQNLYNGSYRENLLSNVFETNSKIAYIIIDKPFEDCRGNEHPYTPIVRSVIRKLNDGRIVIDQIYMPSNSKVDEAGFIELLNRYIDGQIRYDSYGEYDVEYESEDERLLKLPSSYSDRYEVKNKSFNIAKLIEDTEDDDELISTLGNMVGITPMEILENDFVLFTDVDVKHVLTANDQLKRLYYILDGKLNLDDMDIYWVDLVGEYLYENPEKAEELYKYFDYISHDEILKFRETMGRKIDPSEDLESFLKTNEFDRDVRALERNVNREIRELGDVIYRKRSSLRQMLEEVLHGNILRRGIDVRIDDTSSNIYLQFGITPQSLRDWQMENSVSEIREMFEEPSDLDYLNEHELKSYQVMNHLSEIKERVHSDEEFIEEVGEAISEEGMYPLFEGAIEKAINVYIQ